MCPCVHVCIFVYACVIMCMCLCVRICMLSVRTYLSLHLCEVQIQPQRENRLLVLAQHLKVPLAACRLAGTLRQRGILV